MEKEANAKAGGGGGALSAKGNCGEYKRRERNIYSRGNGLKKEGVAGSVRRIVASSISDGVE